jgi:O-antigen/teichoic acid export membrane protein
MRQSTTLIVNAASSLTRRLLTFGIGLAVTRLLLGALGVVDFGLMAVLGGTGALLALAADGLTVSAQRHLAFALGSGDRRAPGEVFTTSLAVFSVVGAAIAAAGALLAEPVVGWLTVPPERHAAAMAGFRLVAVGLAVTVSTTPFRAVLHARQAIALAEGARFISSALQLAAVCVLLLLAGDALVRWFRLLLVCQIATAGVFATLAVARYPEARPRRARIRLALLRPLASFAGWASLLQLGWRLRMQGELILLNLYFGPVVNAAYAVSAQVVSNLVSISSSVLGAVQPAMATRAGGGDRDALGWLAVASGKFSGTAMLLFLVPVGLETPFLLGAWLGDAPALTTVFIRLGLATMFVSALSNGHNAAMQAGGQLAAYTLLWLPLLGLPITVCVPIFAATAAPPWTLPAVSLATSAIATLARAHFVGARIGLPLSVWLRGTVAPVAAVATAGGGVAAIAHEILPAGWMRLLLVAASHAAVSLPLFWIIGLSAWERSRFLEVGQAPLAAWRARRALLGGV